MKGIVTLCGSTRFKKEFDQVNALLTLQEWIVLAPGTWGHSESDREILAIIGDRKENIDVLHKDKIKMSDRVVIISIGGYIGESTRSEISYAHKFRKPITYLNAVHFKFNDLIDKYFLDQDE